MPPSVAAPEFHLIGPNRTDSRNAAHTCHGITQKGRPCRRALATSKVPLTVHRNDNDDDESVDVEVDAAALYCAQHRAQAPRRMVTVRRTGSRASLDELFSRLGIAESDAGVAVGKQSKGSIARRRTFVREDAVRGQRRVRSRDEDEGWVPVRDDGIEQSAQEKALSTDAVGPPRRRKRTQRPPPRKKASFWASLLSCVTVDEPPPKPPRERRRRERRGAPEKPLTEISEEKEPLDRVQEVSPPAPNPFVRRGATRASVDGALYPQLPEMLSTDTLVASMRRNDPVNEPRPPHTQKPTASGNLQRPRVPSGPTTPKRRPSDSARKDNVISASNRNDSPMQGGETNPQPDIAPSPPRTTEAYLHTISHLPPAIAASLLTKLATFQPTGTDGYIYIYWLTDAHNLPLPQPYSQTAASQTSPSTLIPSVQRSAKPTVLLKIGLATNVYRRMKQWEDCGYPKYNWFYPRATSGSTPDTTPDKHVRTLPRANGGTSSSESAAQPPAQTLSLRLESEPDHTRVIRSVDWVEKMIHLELQEQRVKWECPRHKRWHTEWFEVERSRAGITRVFEVVKKWAVQSERMIEGR